MDKEFAKQFTKTKFTRREATRLLDAYQRLDPYEVVDISPALATWFNLIEDEREERYIYATWRSRV